MSIYHQVTGEDVARVIVMCLSHRLRKDPMDKMDGGYKVVMVSAPNSLNIPQFVSECSIISPQKFPG
jgi:hypothetical protein